MAEILFIVAFTFLACTALVLIWILPWKRRLYHTCYMCRGKFKRNELVSDRAAKKMWGPSYEVTDGSRVWFCPKCRGVLRVEKI